MKSRAVDMAALVVGLALGWQLLSLAAGASIVSTPATTDGEAFRSLGRSLVTAIGAEVVPTSTTTARFGVVKDLYR